MPVKLNNVPYKKVYDKNGKITNPITKEEPYLVLRHFYHSKRRNRPTKSQFAQEIGVWNETKHKLEQVKVIIHRKK